MRSLIKSLLGLAVALWLPSQAFAQSQLPANSVWGNPTASKALPKSILMPSCPDSGGNHINWVSGTGFTCGVGLGNGITALTGDVTATGPGSVTATLATAQPNAHTWAATQTFTLAPVFTAQSGSRTALGLGTAATQNTGTSGATIPFLNGTNTWANPQTFSSVAIAGGTITGMPTPSSASDVAIKSYVDGLVSAGFHVLTAANAGTTTVLPNSPTYNNGTAGVGATLTAGSNGALTVDGVALSASNVVVIKNQASALQNGIYSVTNAGSGGAPYVLTRSTEADTPGELSSAYVLIGGGTVNASSGWITGTVTTIGTDAVNWTQFSSTSGVATVGGLSGVIGLGSGLSTSGSNITFPTAQADAHTWASAQTFTVAPVFTDQSGSRTALGLGTAAIVSVPISPTNGGTGHDTSGAAANSVQVANGSGSFVSTVITTLLTNACATSALRPACVLFFGYADIRWFGAATGNPDNQSYIQAAVDYMYSTFSGGATFVPVGTFIVGSSVTMPAGSTIYGLNRATTIITSNNADITVLDFSTSGSALVGLFVKGDMQTSATQATVKGTFSRLATCIIQGGLYSIQASGTDGRVDDCILGAASASGAPLYTTGANWYVNVKFDTIGLTNYTGAIIQAPVGSSLVLENHFVNCDFSGDFSNSSVNINDSMAATRVAINVFVGSVFSTPVIFNTSKFASFVGAEFGANVTVSGTPVTITGSYGFSAITATGAACAANGNITC